MSLAVFCRRSFTLFFSLVANLFVVCLVLDQGTQAFQVQWETTEENDKDEAFTELEHSTKLVFNIKVLTLLGAFPASRKSE